MQPQIETAARTNPPAIAILINVPAALAMIAGILFLLQAASLSDSVRADADAQIGAASIARSIFFFGLAYVADKLSRIEKQLRDRQP